jgi:hypothetical protein
VVYDDSVFPVKFFILIILPREVYEYTNLNQNFFTNFLNPTTDPYSATNLNDSLKHGTGNSRFLPYWLFFPISLINTIFSKNIYRKR